MDELALISLLERITSPDSPQAQAARQKYSNLSPETAEGLMLWDLSDPVREVLAQQPEFGGNVMFRHGLGAFSASMMFPPHLVRRAMKTGPQDAVKWLKKVVGTQEAEVLEILPLWAPAVETRTMLFESIEIRPFKDLPPSRQCQSLEEPQVPRMGFGAYRWSPPTAALVAHWMMQPIWQSGDDAIPPVGNSGVLEEIRMSLSLVAPSALIPAIRWYQFADPDLEDAALGTSYSWSHMEINPIELRSFGEFDAARAAEVVRRYMNIADSDRARFRLAIDRFDRSLRRQNAGDAALELAISLESLLSDGGTELRWKVGLRAALLGGGSRDERVRRRAIVEAIYWLRSQLAHSGTTPPSAKVRGVGRIQTDELIKEGTIAVGNVITAAIERGQLPDWFEAEFGM